MHGVSGRDLQVWYRLDDAIFIGDIVVNIRRALNKTKTVLHKEVKANGRKWIVVSKEVADAIRMYADSGGYAGMTLPEYLDKLFGIAPK